MTPQNVAESMAIAVLQGDLVAAAALADLLKERVDRVPDESRPAGILADSVPLMRQLARMANVPWGRFRRMTLVLDVEEPPMLYTEGFMSNPGELVETAIQHREGVDVTSQRSDRWRQMVFRPTRTDEDLLDNVPSDYEEN